VYGARGSFADVLTTLHNMQVLPSVTNPCRLLYRMTAPHMTLYFYVSIEFQIACVINLSHGVLNRVLSTEFYTVKVKPWRDPSPYHGLLF
jgi:hypothetical protein